MKNVFAAFLVCISSWTLAQKDLTEKDPFSAKLGFSTGSLKTNFILNNSPIQAVVFSPKLELGGVVNLHIGGIIFTTDSGSYDTTRRTQGDMEIGISAEKYLPNHPFYLKGGCVFRPKPSSGQRVFAQVGFEVMDDIDFHLIMSRFFDRKDLLSGTIVEFGVRLNLE